jgi:hypothetical protein
VKHFLYLTFSNNFQWHFGSSGVGRRDNGYPFFIVIIDLKVYASAPFDCSGQEARGDGPLIAFIDVNDSFAGVFPHQLLDAQDEHFGLFFSDLRSSLET